MSLAVRIANRLIRSSGLEVVKRPTVELKLPQRAREHLRPDSSELRQLVASYGKCDAAVTDGYQWKHSTIPAQDLLGFRGDTAYVWQRESDASYALSSRHVSSVDQLGLLDRLTEDGMFGARVVEVDGRLVSRDLLDSILEMNFIQRHHVPMSNVLDIGAGYGRLAHRMTSAFPDVQYTCADGVPVSTFLSRYYLDFRQSSATVTALPDVGLLRANLTVNIHSFTECTVPAVKWWLSRLRTTYLMIVPNAMNHGGTRILNSQGMDLLPIIESYGFGLVAREPKYIDPTVQRLGIQPTWYYLFQASGEPVESAR